MDLFPQLYRLTDRDEQTLLIQPESAVLTAIVPTGSGSVLAVFPTSFPGVDRAFKLQRVSWLVSFPAGNAGVFVTQYSLFLVDSQGVARDLIEVQQGPAAVNPVGCGQALSGGAAAQQYQWTSAQAEEFLCRPGSRLGVIVFTNILVIAGSVSINMAVTGIAIPPGGIGR